MLGKWVRINARGIIVVEGVASCRPELRDYYDVKIYVETPRDLCMARLRERGHGWPEECLQRWAAAEAWYEANELDLNGFDIILCGNSGVLLRSL